MDHLTIPFIIAILDKDPNMGMVWRGRNAAAKALHPPIVDRRNVFALYWNFEATSTEVEGGEYSTLATQEMKTTASKKKSPAIDRPSYSSSSSTVGVARGDRKNSPFSNRPAAANNYKKYSPSATAVSSSSSIPSSRSTGPDESRRSSSPSPSTSSFQAEDKSILYISEFKSLRIRLSTGGAPPEQVTTMVDSGTSKTMTT